MDESRVPQRAGWAGAASVVLLAVGVALCALVGVDEPGVSDAAILGRINGGAKQTAAAIGLRVLAAGVRFVRCVPYAPLRPGAVLRKACSYRYLPGRCRLNCRQNCPAGLGYPSPGMKPLACRYEESVDEACRRMALSYRFYLPMRIEEQSSAWRRHSRGVASEGGLRWRMDHLSTFPWAVTAAFVCSGRRLVTSCVSRGNLEK